MTPFQAATRAIFLDSRRYYPVETAAWRADARRPFARTSLPASMEVSRLIPANLAAKGRAFRGSRTFLASLLVAVSLLASGLVQTAQAQTINGTLMEVDSEQPISLGLVLMLTESGDSITSTVTDSRGRFSISADEPGSFILVASAFGFKETPAGVFELGEDGVMDIEFRIAATPMPIDGLLVSLQRPVLQHNLVRNGFVRRITRGRGRFITPAQIEKSTATSTTDLFREIPGVHLTNPSGGLVGKTVVRMLSAGDYCAPTVYLDGVRISSGTAADMSLDDLVPLEMIDAVEIYRRPSEVPVEYGMTGSGGSRGLGPCGVLVVWTKTR